MAKPRDHLTSFGLLTLVAGLAGFVAYGLFQLHALIIVAAVGMLFFAAFVFSRHHLTGEWFFGLVGLVLCLATLACPWYEGIRNINRQVVVEWWKR